MSILIAIWQLYILFPKDGIIYIVCEDVVGVELLIIPSIFLL